MKVYRSKRAFTLIECLVTTVILGIGVVGVAGMFTYATISEQKASYMAEARHIGEETMEAVRAGGFGVLDYSSGTASLDTSALPRATGTLAWEPYSIGSTGSDDLKLVAVNLSWNWAASSSGTYKVVTLVSTHGGS
jgi:prepilin-type N-terminal cleavage/methylation domain-containing protein